MGITFDSTKNAANIARHGVALSQASEFEWETALVQADTRFEDGENRMRAPSYIGIRLFAVVFVDRGNARRII